ncbi:MAG TPA: hypothetical protein VLS93_09585, partial [Anaeromyxobacteraceae bacterium]|nr:hypothetical protein [Anaeromyxobacteraceae bacterium]
MSVRGTSALALALLVAVPGPARALDPAAIDLQLRLRAAPEGTWAQRGSPFAPAAELAGIGRERGRGEAELRVRGRSLTADLSARTTSLAGSRPASDGVVNELFAEAELAGQHFTLGKKVLPWDVGFGFRPLDVIQQEARRAFLPFALEGVPLVAWERFGERGATAVVWANPLRGRAPRAREDESWALRHYQRLGGLDLHAVGRWSRRTLGEAGAAAAVVLGDAVELHGSALYQRRLERPGDARLDPGAAPIAAADPARVRVSQDAVAALVGLTLTPGRDLSFVAEGWIDPAAPTASEWKAMAALARSQRALLSGDTVPRPLVLANLAWGTRAFGGRSLVRENVYLRATQRWDRLEPEV